MNFEFATANRIVFRCGAARDVPAMASALGGRALLVSGRRSQEAVAASLREGGLEVIPFSVSGEPELDVVRAGVAEARERKVDLVIGWGGGSVLDAGKAIAALVPQKGDVLDFLEVIGRGQPLVEGALPFVAVPTTAGTGSEVTRNAVVGSRAHGAKASLRSPGMLPRLAVIDPELTLSVPRDLTVSTGIDALTQVFEPFVSRRAHPFADMFCREGMRRAARSLRRAVEEGGSLAARTDMCFASLCGGLALANAGLGAVHGFAAPLGGMFAGAPHGALCAALLPHVARANLAALRAREAASPALEKFHEAAVILTGNPNAEADDGVDFLERLCRDLAVPSLRTYGVGTRDVETVVARARQASSMKANPIELSDGELSSVLLAAL